MKQWAIGIDLGGTKIEIAIVSSDGELIDRVRLATQKEVGPDGIIDQIAEGITQLTNKYPDKDITAIGAGVAGQMDKDTGAVVYSPNLDWHNVPLQEALARKTDKPVVIANDVKAAMWGEWRYGAGKGSENIVCIFVGTGIGGGIAVNNHILHGANNTAGEVGHMTIDLHGPMCNCGNRGCFEALAGGWAIARDVQAAARHDKEAAALMLKLAEGNIESLNAHILADAYQQGDTLATKLINNIGEALAAGAVSIVNACGPERLIFGGGIMEGMPYLLDPIKEGVKHSALKAAVQGLQILPAALHNDSGVIGAANLALHQLRKQTQTHHEA